MCDRKAKIIITNNMHLAWTTKECGKEMFCSFFAARKLFPKQTTITRNKNAYFAVLKRRAFCLYHTVLFFLVVVFTIFGRISSFDMFTLPFFSTQKCFALIVIDMNFVIFN